MNTLELFPLYLIFTPEILEAHKKHYNRMSWNSFERLIYRPADLYARDILEDKPLTIENINPKFILVNYSGVIEITTTKDISTDIAWYFNYMMRIANKPVYMTNTLCRSLTSSEENIKAFNEELIKHNIGFIACPKIRYK